MKGFTLAVALLAGTAASLTAQSYRTTVETRRVTGPLRVDVSFAVGELLIRPSDRDDTYRLSMTYAEDLFDPRVRFDANRGRLDVSLGESDVKLRGRDFDASDQELDLALPPNVPVDLTLSFGAIEANIELGGLTLRSAEIKTGASETTVSFASPTRGACERLSLKVGAAEFRAVQLGNSRCRVVSLEGAVGEMLLDFSGDALAAETRLFVKVGLGEVRIRVPEHVGIRLTADRFLASVSRAGLVKQGSAFVSPGYDEAGTKLLIDVDAALGSVEIERTR